MIFINRCTEMCWSLSSAFGSRILSSQTSIRNILKRSYNHKAQEYMIGTHLISERHASSGKNLSHLSLLQLGQASPTPASVGISPRCSPFHTSTNYLQGSVADSEKPVVKVKVASSSVILQSKNGAVEIPLIWLRDHCQCSECYNHATFQRNVNACMLQMDFNPINAELDESQTTLMIKWKDGHTSKFSLKDLQEWFYPGAYRHHSKPFLWNKASLRAHGIPSVPYEEHMNSEQGLKQSLRNLVDFGFTFVDQTPITIEATAEVSERIGKMMPTIYNTGMWALSSGAESFLDTSYSNAHLGAHTDMTYYVTGAGIQVFHGVKHAGSGGETLLVDGFHAANTLREKHPESFESLTSFHVPHHFKQSEGENTSGFYLYNVCPVLKKHPNSGELIQIMYNPYDRAPLNTLPPDQIEDFYTAYGRLSSIIQDQTNELWVKLTPGRVLVIDNWRVLHGRAAFTGHRIIWGCYLQRDEWVSKARVLNLL